MIAPFRNTAYHRLFAAQIVALVGTGLLVADARSHRTRS